MIQVSLYLCASHFTWITSSLSWIFLLLASTVSQALCCPFWKLICKVVWTAWICFTPAPDCPQSQEDSNQGWPNWSSGHPRSVWSDPSSRPRGFCSLEPQTWKSAMKLLCKVIIHGAFLNTFNAYLIWFSGFPWSVLIAFYVKPIQTVSSFHHSRSSQHHRWLCPWIVGKNPTACWLKVVFDKGVCES